MISINKTIDNKNIFYNSKTGFFLSLLIVLMILSVGSAAAVHDATVTISPDIANCDELGNTFTVNVKNDAGSTDDILQVEIYKALAGISDFTCGSAPTGWTLFSFTDRCIYVTELASAYKITQGNNLDFTFDATMSSDTCQSLFIVVTVDDAYPTGDRDTHEVNVNIDCTLPEIEKTVGEPKIAGSGFDWWVTESTLIELSASDNTDVCDLGLDYCRWRITVDGVPGGWITEQNGPALCWDFDFDGDSNHYLEVECYDLAGNKATLTETDKVDDTPPVTMKVISEPKKIEGGVEWVDTATTITLTAVDPDPTGESCNIGVDKIYWANNIVPDDNCLNPESNCNPVDTAYNMVEGDEVIIQKDQESCHLLQYYSVDHLGNKEDMNVNCFFVDKTEPYMYKDNGAAISGSGESLFMIGENSNGDFHWITSSMPITFTCDDTKTPAGGSQAHPSEDEELCFRVSFDYPSWNYEKTSNYCSHFSGTLDKYEDGFCCVAVDGNKKFAFNFLEESMHNLEYYCIDAVEKRTDTHIQYYKVDDTPPYLVDKWIDESYYALEGVCPPVDEFDICHLDGVSHIYIDVLDGGDICAVDDVVCEWKYRVDEGSGYGPYTDWITYDAGCGDIHFPEESKHELVIRCTDALGNYFEDVEIFYVDMTPPETTKTYVGLQYPDPITDHHATHWITSQTEIHLSPTDLVGPHDSGVKETKYRVTLLGSNEACESDARCQEIQTDGGAWTPYTVPFTIGEPSCHLIEYYSVDNVNKIEVTKKQCVFVENTAPTILEKLVGEPKVLKDDKVYISGLTPITMRCEDQGDHPVNHVSIWYRYRVSDDCATWGGWITDGCSGEVVDGWCDPTGEEKVIYFPQDSCHELEYYCVDALGHETAHEFEIDVVDNQAPEITKTIVGPQQGDCPPEEGEDCYIDGITVIHVEVVDPEPHPVDEVVCEWDYEVTDGNKIGQGQSGLGTSFDINFQEESTHVLTIRCEDALHNVVEDVETFIVDKTPPEIHKKYSWRHHYDEEICVEWEKPCWWCSEECVEWKTVEWISSDTKITITVDDAGPHKTGINESKYRYDIVDDDYCWGLLDCQEATTNETWTVMSDPTHEEFYIAEDSCHLIEILSTDNVEKSSTHKQCVFVDNRGPDTVKKIGEPKDEWYPGQPGEPKSYFYPEETAHCWDETNESIECWEATTVTPIKMECDDSWDGDDTHPVGEKKLCFKVDVDAEDKTLKYCMEYGGWYNLFGGECCRYLEPEDETDDHEGCDFFDYKDDCDEVQDLECYEGRKTFYFLEETEHNLKYYCVDKLGNKGPVDDEKFKIEGTKLEIPLYKKWNLISVPFTLLNDDPEVVFDKVFFDGELVDDVSEYIDSVWAYDPDHGMCGKDWCVWSPDGVDNDNLKVMPGWGYWVMVNDKPACEGILDCFWNIFNEEPLWLVIGGSLFSPATPPPSRNLQGGWNLIGYYGTDWQSYPMSDENFMCGEEFQMPERQIFGDKVYCSLNSLIDTQEGYPRWSSLWSYVSCGNHQTEWVGLNTCADPENPIQSMLSRMYAGRGYWVELDVPDIYAPATTCLWNNDFECVWTGGEI